MKKTLLLSLLLLTLCPVPGINQAVAPGKVTFESSDEGLNRAFAWARQRALSYAHDGDPVGQWYEAALPGREGNILRRSGRFRRQESGNQNINRHYVTAAAMFRIDRFRETAVEVGKAAGYRYPGNLEVRVFSYIEEITGRKLSK